MSARREYRPAPGTGLSVPVREAYDALAECLPLYFALSGSLDAPDVLPSGSTVFRAEVRGTVFTGSGEVAR